MSLERKLTPAEADSIAQAGYVFLYPLVFMEAFRQAWAHPMNVFAPLNTRRAQELGLHPNAPASAASVGAWLDLSAGPVVVTIPDSHGRHVIATAFDAWGETLASIGSRQFGTKGGRFVFVGPNAGETAAALPESAVIRTHGERAWLSVHVIGRGESDHDAIHLIASHCTAALLSGGRPARPAAPRLGRGLHPQARVADMSVADFFCAAAALLKVNPPRPENPAALRELRRLGVRPAQEFKLETLDPAVAQFVLEGAAAGRAAVLTEHDATLQREKETWRVLRANGASSDLRRAADVRATPHSAPADDLVHFATEVDGALEPLHGGRRYRLHFDAQSRPPTNAHWSLLVFDHGADVRPRYAISSRTELESNPDGSIDIHIQPRRTGYLEGRANLLPSPRGRFSLVLELVSPRPEALNGAWAPPRIESASEAHAARRRRRRRRPAGVALALVESGSTP